MNFMETVHLYLSSKVFVDLAVKWFDWLSAGDYRKLQMKNCGRFKFFCGLFDWGIMCHASEVDSVETFKRARLQTSVLNIACPNKWCLQQKYNLHKLYLRRSTWTLRKN